MHQSHFWDYDTSGYMFKRTEGEFQWYLNIYIHSRTRLSDFIFTFHFHALEEEMAIHSSVLAWRIPGMGGPGGLPSMGSHRVGHDWSNLAAAAAAGSRPRKPDGAIQNTTSSLETEQVDGSEVWRKSAREFSLAPGDQMFCSIQAFNWLVEAHPHCGG